MNHSMAIPEYDLFERRADGTLSYRGVVRGLEDARVRVHLLADDTDHECFAIHSTTQEVVERVVPPRHDAKKIFQIAYDMNLLDVRASLLRRWGYQVTSVRGNSAAKALLHDAPPYDLFIVGHAAPERTRLEMVHWLRDHYPHVRILALNPAQAPQLDELHYNAVFNSPNVWLPMVAAAISSAPG